MRYEDLTKLPCLAPHEVVSGNEKMPAAVVLIAHVCKAEPTGEKLLRLTLITADSDGEPRYVHIEVNATKSAERLSRAPFVVAYRTFSDSPAWILHGAYVTAVQARDQLAFAFEARSMLRHWQDSVSSIARDALKVRS